MIAVFSIGDVLVHTKQDPSGTMHQTGVLEVLQCRRTGVSARRRFVPRGLVRRRGVRDRSSETVQAEQAKK